MFLGPTQNPGVMLDILTMTLEWVSVTVPEDVWVPLNSHQGTLKKSIYGGFPIRLQNDLCYPI